MIMKNKTMDIERFGEIMDKFLKDSKVAMLVKMPEGTLDVEIEDNTGLGPTIQLYILFQALSKALIDTCNQMGGLKTDEFIDSMMEVVKDEVKARLKKQDD